MEKCLAFCETLVRSGQKFTFNISFGKDKFFFCNKELASSWQQKSKKKSPSQKRREEKRRRERQNGNNKICAKEPEVVPTKAESSEKKVVLPQNFHCDLCNFKVVSEKGLKAHTTKNHKKNCDAPIRVSTNHLNKNGSTVAAASSMTSTPSHAVGEKSKTSKSRHLCWFDKCKKLPEFQSLGELNSHIQNTHD